jgi:hypothetical protein
VLRGRERGTARTPATFLDAGDRQACLALRRHEHGHVEDPVLLCAGELLAVVEQDVRIERVMRQELRHGPGRVDLGHAEAERDRLLEQDVVRARLALREQRRDEDPAVHDGIAELDCGTELR